MSYFNLLKYSLTYKVSHLSLEYRPCLLGADNEHEIM